MVYFAIRDFWYRFVVQSIRNKGEKLEHKNEAIFDIPFIIQSRPNNTKPANTACTASTASSAIVTEIELPA